MKISFFGSILLLLTLNSDYYRGRSSGVAAAERTTVWVLADQQIYSISKGHLICGRLTSESVYTDLLASKYFTIKGKDVGIYKEPPAEETSCKIFITTKLYVSNEINDNFYS